MLLPGNEDLTEDEFEQFLMRDSGLDAPMSMSEIDGLLTAVVIGPVFPPPSQWMPLVWGDEGGPEYSSQAQAERITGLLMRHMNSLSRQLQEDPDEFEPMLLVDLDEDRKRIVIADHWCLGFMAGVSLNEDAWQEVEATLLPFIMFASEPGDAEIDEELETNREYWITQLGFAVAAINRCFLAYRTGGRLGPETVISPEPKVGRNDLCPCGSGKKYKKCCGLH